jgi:hypothetical protein
LFRWPARPTLLTSIAVRMVSDPIMSGMAAIAAVAGSPSAPASASLSRSRIAVTATTSSVQTFFIIPRSAISATCPGRGAARSAAATATSPATAAVIGGKREFPTDTAAGSSRKSAIERSPRRRRQTSTLAVSALSWMNCRRGSTRSPINWSKSTLASSTSLIRTCSNDRALVSSVVSQSCSGFISPRPL